MLEKLSINLQRLQTSSTDDYIDDRSRVVYQATRAAVVESQRPFFNKYRTITNGNVFPESDFQFFQKF